MKIPFKMPDIEFLKNKKVIISIIVLCILVSLSVLILIISSMKSENKVVNESGVVTMDEVSYDSTYIDYEKEKTDLENTYRNVDSEPKAEMNLSATSEEQILPTVYDLCFEGKYSDAELELNAFIKEYPEREVDYRELRDNINVVNLMNDQGDMDPIYILSTITDPEILLDMFLNTDTATQKKIIKIPESIVMGGYTERVSKEKIEPYDLPHFSRHFDSISIQGKEIWKITLRGKYTPADVNYYVIVNPEEKKDNWVYYAEYAEQPKIIPTTYKDLPY